ncbi:alginate lyase family protein [Kiritimatiella glycovorans]|uniref:alginate lyase family protein n=1 Tax=Kiritimatiella glycovorans TaxID=1307763 RepID=UPI001364B203|nr:alginate lyase family protein [Kiritimatiella glycovorans]
MRDDVDADVRLARFAARVPFGAPARMRALLKEPLSAEERDAVRAAAGRAAEGCFDLLGSGPYRFENAIDWHRDIRSGACWRRDFLYLDAAKQTPEGADLKGPWELSRLQHAIPMGLAWLMEEDERYPRAFREQVESWIEANPPGYGVNWACAMEVAIRAVNWLAGYGLMSESLDAPDLAGFRRRFSGVLHAHGRWIRTHLEWLGPCSPSRANHFLADLTGLYTIGLLFGDRPEGRRWAQFARHRLEAEMMHQCTADGVHFERSTGYHRLALEMFLWCRALARSAGTPFSQGFDDRLERMQGFVRDYTKPNGHAPLIGDQDDGRLLGTPIPDLRDHRYLFPPDDSGGTPLSVDRVLLDGTRPGTASGHEGWVAYEQGGFFIRRFGPAWLMVRAGPLAHAGGHAHNDQLSFELNLNGRDLFVDRGTGVYTSDPEVRNRYRSTQAHNVLSINAAEQNSIPETLFGMPDETQTRVVECEKNALEAVHQGFHSLGRSGTECGRRFELAADGMRLRDRLTGLRRGDRLTWRLHLAPGLEAIEDEGRWRIVEQDDETHRCTVLPPRGAQVASEPFAHSPSYGVFEDAFALVFTRVIEDAAEDESFEWSISWADG